MSPETTLLAINAALLICGFALIDEGSRIEVAALRATQTDTPTDTPTEKDTTDEPDDGSRDDDPALHPQDL